MTQPARTRKRRQNQQKQRKKKSKKNPRRSQTPAFQRVCPERWRTPRRPKRQKNKPKQTRKNDEKQRKKTSKKKSRVKPNACVSKGLARKTANPRKPQSTKNKEKNKKGKKSKRPKSFGTNFWVLPAAASCPPGKSAPPRQHCNAKVSHPKCYDHSSRVWKPATEKRKQPARLEPVSRGWAPRSLTAAPPALSPPGSASPGRLKSLRDTGEGCSKIRGGFAGFHDLQQASYRKNCACRESNPGHKHGRLV